MKVELVSYTKSFINDISNIQELVAFCARVSNPSNQSNTQTSERLIKYLLKHKHWSPFEMANVCLEITTTRDIARQILRHRSFSFQEFSQRYADPTKDLSSASLKVCEARLQDSKNRQNSIEIEDEKLQQEWAKKQEDVWKVCNGAYSWAIENGLAKEVSRSVLPEGLMESKLYMNGTVRSWIHYIETRTDPSTQKEHRMIAELCAQKIATVFPLIFELSKSILE